MNDVKQLCEQALAGPEPPLPDAEEVLAVARQVTRRRNLRRVSYGLGAAAAVVAAVALLIPEVLVAQPAPPPPVAAASPPPQWVASLPPAPTGDVARAHLAQILPLLAGALPEDHTLAPLLATDDQPPGDEWSPWYAPLAGDSYVVTLTALVTSGDGTGALQLVVRGGRPAPAGDLCAPDTGAGFAEPAGARCRLITIDDGPIRLVTGDDPERGEVHAATRFLADGYLTVVAQQAVPLAALDPEAAVDSTSGSFAAAPLAAAPLTAPELAVLVTDPAMLP